MVEGMTIKEKVDAIEAEFEALLCRRSHYRFPPLPEDHPGMQTLNVSGGPGAISFDGAAEEFRERWANPMGDVLSRLVHHKGLVFLCPIRHEVDEANDVLTVFVGGVQG